MVLRPYTVLYVEEVSWNSKVIYTRIAEVRLGASTRCISFDTFKKKMIVTRTPRILTAFCASTSHIDRYLPTL